MKFARLIILLFYFMFVNCFAAKIERSSPLEQRIDDSIAFNGGVESLNSNDSILIQRTIDKFTVFHILYDIFKTSSKTSNASLKLILKNNIHDYPFVFGQSCSPYQLNTSSYLEDGFSDDKDSWKTWYSFGDLDNDYSCNATSHTSVHFNQVSNVLRAGLMQKVCGNIIFPELESIDNDSDDDLLTTRMLTNPFVFSAINKAGITHTKLLFTKENVKKIIQLFYPFLKKRNNNSLIPDELVKDIMKDLNIDDKLDINKKYRLLLYILCIDPGWQM